MTLGEKIKAIREEESLTRKEFAELTGISFNTLGNYEYKQRSEISSKELQKITNHPRFRKYTLWLMTDENHENYEAEQTAPGVTEFGELIKEFDESKLDQLLTYMKFLLQDAKTEK